MADIFVDMGLSTGLNDGTSWANAYQDNAGFDTALTAANHAAGDDIWVQGNSATTTTAISSIAINTLAAYLNPVRVHGVKAGTTNEPPVQSDLVPGHRTGNATRAYDQTSGNAAPQVTCTGTQDIALSGSIHVYGIVFSVNDKQFFQGSNSLANMMFEECSFTAVGAGDEFRIGVVGEFSKDILLRKCKLVATTSTSNLILRGWVKIRFEDCDMDLSNTTGAMQGIDFQGEAIFDSCDFSGSATPLVDIGDFTGDGTVEFHNCTMPASHVLTTGTAVGKFTVRNYGSDDKTALGSTDSEQILEIRTNQGTIDLETTVVRTGGASDGADGAFAWAIVANNVVDNIVPITSLWMYLWVDGDGTAKTLSVFFANDDTESAANLLEDDEIYLEVEFPSEAGISRFDLLPDDGAPGDGGGKMQLLGTAADIATDGSTWGTGGNNKQKLTQSIAPDYQGPIRCRVHFSKSATPPTLYLDPKPEIA